MDIVTDLLIKERERVRSEVTNLENRLLEIDNHLKYYPNRALSLGQLAILINCIYSVEIRSKVNTDKLTCKARFEFSYLARHYKFTYASIADILDITTGAIVYHEKQHKNRLFRESLKNQG